MVHEKLSFKLLEELDVKLPSSFFENLFSLYLKQVHHVNLGIEKVGEKQ